MLSIDFDDALAGKLDLGVAYRVPKLLKDEAKRKYGLTLLFWLKIVIIFCCREFHSNPTG